MKKLWKGLLLIPILFASCMPNYYVANQVNTPLHKEKGEVRAGGSIGVTSEFLGLELNSSYAVTSHTGIILSGSYFSGSTIEPNTDQLPNGEPNLNFQPFNRSAIGELGYGFFLPFGVDSMFIFETYAGYSFYSNQRAINSRESVSYLFHRPFIQSAIGFRHKFAEVSLGLRLISLYPSNISGSTAFKDNDNLNNYLLFHKNRPFVEPFISVAMGWTNIKIQLQWVSQPWLQNELYHVNERFPLNTRLGVQLRF